MDATLSADPALPLVDAALPACPAPWPAYLKRFGGSRLRLSFLLRTRTTLLWMAALTQ